MKQAIFCFVLFTIAVLSCERVKSEVIEKITARNIPGTIVFKGNIQDGIKFKDLDGTHYVLISLFNKGTISEKGWISELYAYKYTFKNGIYSKRWEVYDHATDERSGMKYLQGSLKIMDIDSDGIYESRFLYSISRSGDPFTVKYLLHFKNDPYMISGEVPIGFDESTDCETNLGSSFKNLAERYTTFAKNDWYNIMKSTFSCFVVGKK